MHYEPKPKPDKSSSRYTCGWNSQVFLLTDVASAIISMFFISKTYKMDSHVEETHFRNQEMVKICNKAEFYVFATYFLEPKFRWGREAEKAAENFYYQ